jgi:hypothetical protein
MVLAVRGKRAKQRLVAITKDMNLNNCLVEKSCIEIEEYINNKILLV